MSLARIRSFFRNLLRRPQVDEQLDQEVTSYLDLLTEENIAAGMSRQQALRAAKIELGGSDQVKEHVRDVRSGAWLQSLFQDFHFGTRMIAHNPGFSALVILTLALGIGANTAIFSVVYGVLLRPLPYVNGSQLVVLRQEAAKANIRNVAFSPKEVLDYRDYNHTLQSVVEYHSMSFLLLGKDSAERVQTGVVSANFFDVLGVKPVLGRTFISSDEDKHADAVLVLSYQYWQRHQGGDPNIVGKVFQMNNRPHTVIGVLPPIPQYPAENDVYMPTSQCPFRSDPKNIANRQFRLISAVFGRLKSETTLLAAQADLSTVARQLETSYPKDYPKEYGYGLAVAPLQTELTQRARTTLIVLLAAAGFVLLIACANVANLMLARILKRERELAVRSALGASKSRLIRQLLTESIMLAVTGGVLGLLIAPPALRLLVQFAARFTTRADEVKMDWPVLLFTLLASVGAGILAGVAPALASGRGTDALKQATGQTTASNARQRLRAALVVAQVAVSFVLLVGAGLMLRSIVTLQRVDPGFRLDHLLTMRLSINFTHYKSPEDGEQLSDNLLRRLSAVGGVESAGIGTNYPFSRQGIIGGPGKNGIQVEGRLPTPGAVPPQVDADLVSPEYFTTIRQPLLLGRAFTDHDDEKALKVAIVNQSLKRHVWPSENPIGKRISSDQGKTWITIAGVVGDAREYGIERGTPDHIYLPVMQNGGATGGANRIVLRTALDPLSVLPLVRAAIRNVDPQLAIDQVDTMERLQQDSLASPRTTTILLGIFAGLALLISGTGIAGVMALSISQRTRELGVRMALGQSRRSIIQMVIQQGLALAIAGTVLGIVGALGLARLLSSLLYQTSPTDALTYMAVALVFLSAALVSCFLPAHRVTMIDPSQCLRQE
jgi:predicted permease